MMKHLIDSLKIPYLRVFVLCCLLLFEQSNISRSHADSIVSQGLDDLFTSLPFVEGFDASVETRQYLDAKKDSDTEDYYENRNDIRFGSDLSFGNNTTARLSAQQYLHYGKSSENYHAEQTNFRLWEAYLDFEQDSFSIRLGQQLLRWGKGDEINPIDVFSQENFREFINRDRAERKMPTLALDANYYVNDQVRLELVWLPFFEENLFAGTDQDWEFFFRREYRNAFGLEDIPENKPSNSLNNSSIANRLVFEREWGDFSFMHAYHYDQNVNYAVTTDPSAIDPELGPVVAQWERLHTFGADFETEWEGFGLRGELAFTHDKPSVTLDLSDNDLIVKNDTFSSVLGFDHSFADGTYLNLQLVQDVLLDRKSKQYNKDYDASYTWRLRKDFWRERLRLEFTGRAFITQRDWFFHLGGAYEVAEGAKLTAEYHFFAGSEDRIFGQFDDNDQFVLGFRYLL
jgi:hypothetical protein